MARIMIAGASAEKRAQISRLLSASGFAVFRCCASGSELRRALSACGGGVVLLLGGLPDAQPDELQWDWGERARILLIARPELLAACESPEIFRLALPASGQAVVGALEMLTQFYRMRLPRRSGEDKEIVEEAKRLLMRREGLTEPEAHRALQRYAMNNGLKMADYAAEIIQKNT